MLHTAIVRAIQSRRQSDRADVRPDNKTILSGTFSGPGAGYDILEFVRSVQNERANAPKA